MSVNVSLSFSVKIDINQKIVIVEEEYEVIILYITGIFLPS